MHIERNNGFSQISDSSLVIPDLSSSSDDKNAFLEKLAKITTSTDPIGQGSYGSVYRYNVGELQNIAIKKLI